MQCNVLVRVENKSVFYSGFFNDKCAWNDPDEQSDKYNGRCIRWFLYCHERSLPWTLDGRDCSRNGNDLRGSSLYFQPKRLDICSVHDRLQMSWSRPWQSIWSSKEWSLVFPYLFQYMRILKNYATTLFCINTTFSLEDTCESLEYQNGSDICIFANEFEAFSTRFILK